MKKTILFIAFALVILSEFSSGYASYATQSYSNIRSYNYQQNYNPNYAAHGYNYVPVNAWGRGSQPNYVASRNSPILNRHNYGYNSAGPYLFPSTSYNSIFGSRTTYSSHFYINSAVDQAYAKHPEMLEPRRMQNNMRNHKGFYI